MFYSKCFSSYISVQNRWILWRKFATEVELSGSFSYFVCTPNLWYIGNSRISLRKDTTGGILRKQSRHMPREMLMALTNYASELSRASLPEYHVFRHIIMPSVPKDSAMRLSTKRVQSLSSPVRVRVSQEYSETGRTSERTNQPSSFCTSTGSATHLRPANSSRPTLDPVVDWLLVRSW